MFGVCGRLFSERAANMRFPRFKQPTVYAKPDVLERPRLESELTPFLPHT